MLKRLVTIMMVAGLFGLLPAASAIAIEWASPPSEPGLYKNPDGTYSLWEMVDIAGKKEMFHVKNYTSTEHGIIDRLNKAMVVDDNTTGNKGIEVSGITTEEASEAEKMTNNLRTGEKYASIGEKNVGNEIIAESEADGFLPSLAEVAGAASGVVAGAGALLIGIHIGDGVDELLGWPKLLKDNGGGLKEEGGYAQIYEWLPEFEINSVTTCSGISVAVGHTLPEGEDCEGTSELARTYEEHPIGTGGYAHEEKIFGPSISGFLNPPCPTGAALCFREEEGEEHGTTYLYFSLSQLEHAGFTSKGLKAKAQQGITSGESKDVEKRSEQPIGTTPSREGPAVVLPYITHEQEHKLLPGVGETGEKPIPDPTLAVVPEIKPLETYQDYLPEVEEAGFTNIQENVVPESEISGDTGPEGVIAVSPVEGTRTESSTRVRVDVNPDDAATPPEGGAIGPPTLPGLKLPELHLLCTTMPFGVPCWLVKQLEAFSGTATAPVWKVGPISWGSVTIPAASIHLDTLEPVMEVVRPFMVLFGTIGIVLLFYRIFTGHSIGHGENPAGEVPDPDAFDPDRETLS